MLGLGPSQQVGSVTLEFPTDSKRVNLLVMRIMFIKDLSLHWIRIPQIPSKECYPLAQYLIAELHPELLAVMAPLYVDPDHPVQVLCTSKSEVDLPEHLHLKPPHYITGIYASLISFVSTLLILSGVYHRADTATPKAEISNSKAVALLVTADGVPDHEFVEDDYAVASAEILSKVISPSGAPWKLDLATLPPRIRSSGMYI